jgi:membrane protease YdiL (CAAX protease family)
VNSSTYTISPSWPTRWPQGSFKPGPTALVILALIVLTVFILIACSIWLVSAHLLRPGATPPITVSLVIQLIVEIPLMIVLLSTLPWLSGFTLTQLGFVPPRLWQIGVAFVGAIVMAIVANGGATLIENITKTKHEQVVVQMFKQIHDPQTIAFFAVFAIVLAPIAEETIFRIFFFNIGLRYGGFWTGAIVSGILFGAAHGDVFALIPLALGGVVLAGVYYYTRNAFASMITHGLFNTLTVAALTFAPQLAK